MIVFILFMTIVHSKKRAAYVQGYFPFLLMLVLHTDYGTISNPQIVWWGLLMLAPINAQYLE